MPKPKKKRKKRGKQEAAGQEQTTPAEDGAAQQEAPAEQTPQGQNALPSIFGAPTGVLGSGRDAVAGIKEEQAIVEDEDLEISDQEAPDVE